MRRNAGAESHEVRRGHVDEAGPLAEEGIDPGRSVVPVGAEAECDVTLRAFDGGIAAVGHGPGALGRGLPPVRHRRSAGTWSSP